MDRSLADAPPDTSRKEGANERPTVLVVDDDLAVQDSFDVLLGEECSVIQAGSGEQAVEILGREHADLVLLDVRLPGIDGIETLERLKKTDESVEVIMVTAVSDVRTAVRALKAGAYDYLTKPFIPEEILPLVRRTLERRRLVREILCLRIELEEKGYLSGIESFLGKCQAMQAIFRIIEQVADTKATVLISGETGTGKELIARAFHMRSDRKKEPFVAVNCAAIPENLLESEFFGHERGAFTGAVERHLGKFELAHNGTLFLDEVSSLRLDMQAKLLRAIQFGEFERVGGSRTIRVNIRLVAATNQNLAAAVRAKTFREDLFYRLNVVPVTVPPLRNRREDIPLLLEYFLEKKRRELNRLSKRFSVEAVALLTDYPWPGNVREMENLVERLVALTSGPVIGVESLPFDLFIMQESSEMPLFTTRSLKEARRDFEKYYLLRILSMTGWKMGKTSEILKIHRNSLHSKMRQLGIRVPE